MNVFETTDRSMYGASESNGLVNGHEYHGIVDYSEVYSLAEVKEAGGKITRVRFLTENIGGRRLADVSYIHATLGNGQVVPVQIGCDSGPLRLMKGEFIAWAAREGVFAKGLGLLDSGNWSVMY